MKTHSPNIRAFGLLDSFVAIALLGIILFLSLPVQREIETSLYLRSEADFLKQSIERSVILARQKESELKLLLLPTNYLLSTADDTQQLDYHKLHPSTYIELPSAPPKVLHFYPSGVVTPSSLRVRSNDNSLCDLRLSLRGRVTLICS